VTPAQCSAARRLLDWSANELARRSGIAATTVAAFERNSKRTNEATMRVMRYALEDAGIVFVKAGSGDVDAFITECSLSDGSMIRLTRKR